MSSTRMTNKQLAAWLAHGNGQVAYGPGSSVATFHCYTLSQENLPVVSVARIRRWGSNVWEEPFVETISTKDLE